MQLVDTHCHLDFDAFEADLEQVLGRAWENGVIRILNPGIDLETSRKAVQIAEAHPNVFAAVGVHPNEALTWDSTSADALRELAGHPKVVAIGEIGLDYYRDHTPRDIQQVVFRTQIELAAELGLPIIVHTRQSLPDTLAMIGDWLASRPTGAPANDHSPGVLHSFDGEILAVESAVALGLMIGVSGPVTFQNAHQRREVLAHAPLKYLVLETDAPFLTPHPVRGQRNEPAYIHWMAESLATLHHQTIEAVAEITTANADRLYKWST